MISQISLLLLSLGNIQLQVEQKDASWTLVQTIVNHLDVSHFSVAILRRLNNIFWLLNLLLEAEPVGMHTNLFFSLKSTL